MCQICQITRELVLYFGAGGYFEHYVFNSLRPDEPQNSHKHRNTRKQLFFYALQSVNVTW